MMRRSGLVLLGSLGCLVSEPNPGHCIHGRGDEFCRNEHGDAAPFCAVGSCEPDAADGCVPQQPEPNCWSPCGQGQTAVDNAACADDTDGTFDPSTSSSPTGSSSPSTSVTTTSTDTTVDPTTGTEICLPGECPDPQRPICLPTGECVPCGEAAEPETACAMIDEAFPACDGDACVACTGDDVGSCGGITPVCDAATNTCVACTYHEQCPASACDIGTGACLDGVDIFYVDVSAGSCPGSGTEMAPFCTIQRAIDEVASGASGVILVAAGTYGESLEIGNGKKIALLAQPGARPIVDPIDMVATLEISLSATSAYVEGLSFRNNGNTHAISITDATAVLDRVESVANSGGGLHIDSSDSVKVRNCIIGENAPDVDMVLIEESVVEILYTTVVGGTGTVEAAHAVMCANNSEVSVRNSFFASTGSNPEFVCPDAIVAFTASETTLAGNQNATLGPLMSGWYTNFAGDNYRLGTPPDEVLDTAHWQTGDPTVDIDGDLRPTRNDALDAAGADR